MRDLSGFLFFRDDHFYMMSTTFLLLLTGTDWSKQWENNSLKIINNINIKYWTWKLLIQDPKPSIPYLNDVAFFRFYVRKLSEITYNFVDEQIENEIDGIIRISFRTG